MRIRPITARRRLSRLLQMSSRVGAVAGYNETAIFGASDAIRGFPHRDQAVIDVFAAPKEAAI